MCTLGPCFAPYPLLTPSFSPPTFPPYRFSVWAALAWPVLTGQHLATSLPCSHADETLASPVLAFYLFQSCSSHCPGFSFCMILVLPDPREVPFLFQHPSALEVGKRPHSSRSWPEPPCPLYPWFLPLSPGLCWSLLHLSSDTLFPDSSRHLPFLL